MPSQIQKLTKEYVWLAYHAMRANYKNFNIAIHEDYAKDIPPVRLIPQDFSRAVLNVMNNACYAVWRKWQDTPEGYSPEITVSLEKLDKRIVLTIRDNGAGMSPEVKQRLFDSFFTTKPVGQGTGLGMSIVRDIIESKTYMYPKEDWHIPSLSGNPTNSIPDRNRPDGIYIHWSP